MEIIKRWRIASDEAWLLNLIVAIIMLLIIGTIEFYYIYIKEDYILVRNPLNIF